MEILCIAEDADVGLDTLPVPLACGCGMPTNAGTWEPDVDHFDGECTVEEGEVGDFPKDCRGTMVFRAAGSDDGELGSSCVLLKALDTTPMRGVCAAIANWTWSCTSSGADNHSGCSSPRSPCN